MGQLLNQYSSLWIAGGFVLLALLVLFRERPKVRNFVALGIVGIGLVLAWVMIHPRQTPSLKDAVTVQSMIGQGVPVLLEFQSPY